MNELVASHEQASNEVINIEHKTEREITELSKEYVDLSDQVKEIKKGEEKRVISYILIFND